MSIEAMKQALEALTFDGFTPQDVTHRELTAKAVEALRTAIQQAESEPVGEPRARVELMKTGGNVGLSTRIIELDIATRERLRPGDLLYTHPAPGVPDDEWVSVDDRIPRIDGETNYIGVNSAGFMCVFNALMGAKCPNSGRVVWHCDMETAEESIRMMSGLAYWMKAPAITSAQAQKGGE